MTEKTHSHAIRFFYSNDGLMLIAFARQSDCDYHYYSYVHYIFLAIVYQFSLI